jgi:hypothetical protein
MPALFRLGAVEGGRVKARVKCAAYDELDWRVGALDGGVVGTVVGNVIDSWVGSTEGKIVVCRTGT